MGDRDNIVQHKAADGIADRHWIITLLPADEDFTSETMEYASRMGVDGRNCECRS